MGKTSFGNVKVFPTVRLPFPTRLAISESEMTTYLFKSFPLTNKRLVQIQTRKVVKLPIDIPRFSTSIFLNHSLSPRLCLSLHQLGSCPVFSTASSPFYTISPARLQSVYLRSFSRIACIQEALLGTFSQCLSPARIMGQMLSVAGLNTYQHPRSLVRSYPSFRVLAY